MGKVMVSYKVKPEAAAQNEALVKQVYEEIHRIAPANLHYATFVGEDGLRFVHISSSEGDGPSPMTELASFRAFQADIAERCDEPPVRTQLREIGSYGFWAD